MGQGFEQFTVTAVDLGLGQRKNEAGEPDITDAIAFGARLMAERTNEVSFTAAAANNTTSKFHFISNLND